MYFSIRFFPRVSVNPWWTIGLSSGGGGAAALSSEAAARCPASKRQQQQLRRRRQHRSGSSSSSPVIPRVREIGSANSKLLWKFRYTFPHPLDCSVGWAQRDCAEIDFGSTQVEFEDVRWKSVQSLASERWGRVWCLFPSFFARPGIEDLLLAATGEFLLAL